MKLGALMADASLICPEEYANVEISEVVSDSRRLSCGCVYVCIRGGRHDGHLHVKEALDAGAAAVIVERGRDDLPDSPKIIEADNTRRVLSYLMNAVYSHPAERMKLVAVTGTNGKTSVTNILRAIFEHAGYRTGLVGTLGCFSPSGMIDASSDDPAANMTTPDPEQLYAVLAKMRDDGVQYVFMEASSHSLYFEKLAPLCFECAVFTNLTPEHLDFHGSMENYLDAKLKLFRSAKLAVVNHDCPEYEKIKEICGHMVSCSTHDREAEYFAYNLWGDLQTGTKYEIVNNNEEFDVSSRLIGDFNVMNTLLAFAAARELGISADVIKEAISSFDGVPGRLERVECDGAARVFIDYAHTPDALENVLMTVRGFMKANQSLTVLFGCGGDRDRSKRAKMGKISVSIADLAIITSDNCRSEAASDIIAEILLGIKDAKNYVVVPERRDALRLAAHLARRGDAVILAGKGHEKYEIIGNQKLPFDESALICEFLSERGYTDYERKESK